MSKKNILLDAIERKTKIEEELKALKENIKTNRLKKNKLSAEMRKLHTFIAEHTYSQIMDREYSEDNFGYSANVLQDGTQLQQTVKLVEKKTDA